MRSLISVTTRLVRGLPTQLLFLVIVPSAILLLLIAAAGAVLHERAVRELIGERDFRATEVAANNLDERLLQREIALTRLANQITPSELLQTSPGAELFDGGLWLSDDLEAMPAGLSGTGWNWYRDEETSRFTRHRRARFQRLILGIPTPDERILYGAVTLDGLGIPDLLASLQTTDETHIYLVDQQGFTVYGHALDADDSHVGQQVSHNNGVEAVLQGEAGYLQDSSLFGEDLVVGYSPIPRLGWGLMVEDPWHAESSRWLRFWSSIQIMVAATILVGFLAVSFGTLRIVRPLQHLKTRAAALMNGDFAAIREPVGGVQEIEDLRQALDQMSRAVQASQAQLREYIRIITLAQEDERTRLARDLHDDTVQNLIALGQQVQMIQRSLERDPKAASQRLSEVRGLTEKAVQDLRAMIQGLRPSYLTELGLVAALEMLAEQEKNPSIAFEVAGEARRLPADTELALYRIAQEAVNNIRKHSHAQNAHLQLQFSAEQLLMSIKDDGQGFQVPPLQRLSVDGHYGLVGMQERAQLINASLTISSTPPAGTTVQISVPIS